MAEPVATTPEQGLAIVAGRGPLPRLLAEHCRRTGRPYRVVVLDGVALDWLASHPAIAASFEKPGRLFAALRASGCTLVTFAGGIRRPSLNPLRFDLTMMRLAPRLVAGLRQGDDALLRLVAGIFEAEGLAVVAPHAILPDLPVGPGPLTARAPTEADRKDAARAAAIVEALGAVDVGQAAVVAQGVCLGLESIQGTDALLDFVARTAGGFRPDPDGPRGVLFKGPKPGQDLRLDRPAVGPDTVAGAARAGLAGIAMRSGGVMLFDRAASVAAADAAGLFLYGTEDAG
jgi:UDP-2,3-diacylglucosamine hydrolase